MNSSQLTLAFHRATFQRYEMAVPNVCIAEHEWDICAVRKGSNFLDEIEIKITRSDFLADFKKTGQCRVPLPSSLSPERPYTHWKWWWMYKHDQTSNGDRKCNYFWFLMPEDLAQKCIDDIPEHAGLMVAVMDRNEIIRIDERKPAPRLHSKKYAEKNGFLYTLARKGLYKYWNMAHRAENLR